MTKVQLKYALSKPLDDELLKRISTAHGMYGFQKIQVTPELDAIVVEYDATRLNPVTVVSALKKFGLPIHES